MSPRKRSFTRKSRVKNADRHNASVVAAPKDTSTIELSSSVSIRQLATLLHVSETEVIKQLMRNGIMANINQAVDFQSAELVVTSFGRKSIEIVETLPSAAKEEGHEDEGIQQPRPPVVTIMGHVDHGKTTLLDVIRQTNVAEAEVGSITQHVGAYQVEINNRKITFLDTPGHEAFASMRARGANVTDIAVIVVAADDGVMPQTIEAITHARVANVPIVIALNKIDKANSNLDLVKKQLSDQNVLIEEWGGDVISALVSAKKGEGIKDLLESILLVAEIMELTANPFATASGAIVEAGLDKNRGPIATILVQNGTIKVGDTLLAGETLGRIKAMLNDKGTRIKTAGPSTPVKVLGLDTVPLAGDKFSVVASEQEARLMLEKIQEKKRHSAEIKQGISLDSIFSQIQDGQIKELNVILKTDVQGSIEPIRNSIERLSSDKAKIKILSTGSGNITESDVLLASASNAIIIGFATQPDLGARCLSEVHNVDIRCYKVIYELVEQVEKALLGILEPTYEEVIEGRAEIKEVFAAGKRIKIAGVLVAEGIVRRDAKARVIRNGEVLYESTVESLKRFKQNAKEVAAGLECGVGLVGVSDFQPGDTIELYRKERVGAPSR